MSEDDRTTAAFGRRLRALREAKGLSLEDVAARAGMHFTAVGRLERGAREPKLGTILRLAKALGVEPDELVRKLR